MAGATPTNPSGARRALDSEIDMIPMIDLMMVTVAFLLITAVWTHLARVEASASVPGTPGPNPPRATPRLHVEMRDDARFVLHWNDGPTVLRTRDVPRRAVAIERGRAEQGGGIRFPELAAALEAEWRAAGVHTRADDAEQDQLVLHTSDTTPYAEIIGAIDAAYEVKRATPRGASAFTVTFATN
jgi:biopolymer transport protein ExbD